MQLPFLARRFSPLFDSLPKLSLRVLSLPLLALALLGTSAPVLAKDKFKVCWTIYVGWMPWGYGEQTGIVKKWAKNTKSILM